MSLTVYLSQLLALERVAVLLPAIKPKGTFCSAKDTGRRLKLGTPQLMEKQVGEISVGVIVLARSWANLDS